MLCRTCQEYIKEAYGQLVTVTDPSPGIEAIDKIMGHYGVKKVADTVGATEVTDQVIEACRAAGRALAAEVKQLQTV